MFQMAVADGVGLLDEHRVETLLLLPALVAADEEYPCGRG
jgi:hypothetical protein